LKAEEELIMLRVLIVGLLLTFAAGASAQLYRWVDQDGKVRYSDTPPVGVKATTLKPPPGSSAPDPAEADAAAKGAKKGPLTPVEREAEYRKRQADAQKGREKEDQAQRDLEAKRDNCTRAKESLAALESGQRVSRYTAEGERYYLDDAQRAPEIGRARESVNSWCN